MLSQIKMNRVEELIKGYEDWFPNHDLKEDKELVDKHAVSGYTLLQPDIPLVKLIAEATAEEIAESVKADEKSINGHFYAIWSDLSLLVTRTPEAIEKRYRVLQLLVNKSINDKPSFD